MKLKTTTLTLAALTSVSAQASDCWIVDQVAFKAYEIRQKQETLEDALKGYPVIKTNKIALSIYKDVYEYEPNFDPEMSIEDLVSKGSKFGKRHKELCKKKVEPYN